jgi:hypothetical protein
MALRVSWILQRRELVTCGVSCQPSRKFPLYTLQALHWPLAINSPLLVESYRTAEKFVANVCRKFSIDVARVKKLLFLDTKGILNEKYDEVLQNLHNEQPLNVEFVPVSVSSAIIGSVGSLIMLVHL